MILIRLLVVSVVLVKLGFTFNSDKVFSELKNIFCHDFLNDQQRVRLFSLIKVIWPKCSPLVKTVHINMDSL